MKNLRSVLVIVDPTVVNDHVIERAKMLAQLTDARVELFINCHAINNKQSLYQSAEAASAAGLASDTSLQLSELLVSMLEADFAHLGISASIDLCYSKDLVQSIIDKVKDTQPDIVLKSTHRHSWIRRMAIANTDWQLIKLCPVPLLLVKPLSWNNKGCIIAAVDPLHSHAEQTQLDDELLSTTEFLAATLKLTARVFHAYYSIESDYLNPAISRQQSHELSREHNQKMYQLLSKHNYDPEFVKIARGETASELFDYTNTVGCNILVIGALSRGRLERMIVGSTAEKILENIGCDVLILKPNSL